MSLSFSGFVGLFETGCHPRMALNSRASCLSLLGTGIASMYHHIKLLFLLFLLVGTTVSNYFKSQVSIVPGPIEK
jgi:hypothetical protein